MGRPNIAVLETYLKDILFTKEEIAKNVELREHIFEIKDGQNSLGFISLYDLKAYVFEHEDEARNYFVKNIDSEEWKNIFEHPFFQRRRPQLISTEQLKDNDDQEFYILIKGQKNGPFEKYELTEKLENKDILLTDMVSSNGGHTWIKLYQVDGFDRRSLKGSDELPGMPDNDLLTRPSEKKNSITDDTDAITSLAYLGNIKRGKTIERERESYYQGEMSKKASTSSLYKWLLVLSIIGIGYFLWNIKSHLNSPFKDSPNPIGEQQADMLTPVETSGSGYPSPAGLHSNSGINDQRRAGKFETRPMNPPRAVKSNARKSFMDTRKFKQATADLNEGSSGDDNSYYYDNAAPMELDPVRAQISKENYENGAEPAPAPDSDPLFNQEVQN